jgi:sulfite exporter TauE/SafE
MDITQLIGIFLTGLLAGGLSCMAVQGGLLAATIAQRHEDRLKEQVKEGTILPISSFLLAKLVAYTVLGFLLGSLGSAFQISANLQIVLQFVVIIFMLGTALNMLKVHPIFRYFVIQPPYFLTKLIRRESKSHSIFAPMLLGFFTVFIPCGTTQAMMALSIASGNPLTGALILFSFILGTSPIFFLLGYFTKLAAGAVQQSITKFAAIVILSLALFNFNNAIALTGSSFTVEHLSMRAWCFVSFCQDDIARLSVTNNEAITIDGSGYTPRNFSVKAGEPVTLRLTNVGGGGCTQAFTIPQLGLQKIVPVGKSSSVQFIAPQQKGQLSFMCSMGMYRGTINVI